MQTIGSSAVDEVKGFGVSAVTGPMLGAFIVCLLQRLSQASRICCGAHHHRSYRRRGAADFA